MNPNIWGRYFWRVIHITALGFPQNPTEEEKQNYKRFFKELGAVLPCKKCTHNYYRHWDEIPIDLFLENQNDLFKWTIHLHNIVNKEIGKVQWSLEFATHYYNTLIDRSALQLKQKEVVQQHTMLQDKKKEHPPQMKDRYTTMLFFFLIVINIIVILVTIVFLTRS